MSELAKALAAFHQELPVVAKGSENKHFGSRYADLADIVKVVLPELAKAGLTWISRPTFTENGYVLAYELRHESGENVTGEWPLPDPEKAKPQELGSALTYARRYTLSSVTGIAADDDDDGNHASSDTAPRAAKPTRTQAKLNDAVRAIQNAATLEALDRIEDHAKTVGIAGVDAFAQALAARRVALAGTVETDINAAWSVAPIPEPS